MSSESLNRHGNPLTDEDIANIRVDEESEAEARAAAGDSQATDMSDFMKEAQKLVITAASGVNNDGGGSGGDGVGDDADEDEDDPMDDKEEPTTLVSLGVYVGDPGGRLFAATTAHAESWWCASRSRVFQRRRRLLG